MNDHGRRIFVEMADLIERSRSGNIGMLKLLNDLWGMFEAAEVREPEVRARFEALSAADDARQPWIPPELELDRDVDGALDALYKWLRGLMVTDNGGDPVM